MLSGHGLRLHRRDGVVTLRPGDAPYRFAGDEPLRYVVPGVVEDEVVGALEHQKQLAQRVVVAGHGGALARGAAGEARCDVAHQVAGVARDEVRHQHPRQVGRVFDRVAVELEIGRGARHVVAISLLELVEPQAKHVHGQIIARRTRLSER